MTPEEIARRSAEAMWARDDASKWLGLSLDEVEPGRAVMSMVVEKHHTNGHDICHGGFIFTLADSTFAFACNSHNRIAVAQQVSITFIAPGQLGDRLVAKGHEVSRQGRSGVYDIEVARQDGTLVATFRGLSRTIKGTHFDEEDEQK